MSSIFYIFLHWSFSLYLPFSHFFLPCHFLRNSCLRYAVFFSPALLFIFARSVSSIFYLSLQRSFSCHLAFSRRRAMDINVFGLIRGIQTVLPLIRFSLCIYLALEEIFNNVTRKAKGRVVTITSGLGVMAVPTRWKKMSIILQGVPKKFPFWNFLRTSPYMLVKDHFEH